MTSAARWRGLRAAAAPWIAPALLAYFVLLGGTDAAVTSTSLRTLNAAVGAGLIVGCARRVRRDHDRLDLAIAVALGAFLVTALVSRLPRQSFDAALAATAYAAALYLARRELADPVARRRVITVLAAIGGGLAAAFALLWGSAWLEWGRLTDFVAWPPVDLRLSPAHLRHPQVVAMLVALLLPALVLTAARARGVVAALWVAGIALCLLVIVMSGSRTTWLGLAVAGLVALVLSVAQRKGGGYARAGIWVLGASGLAAIGAVAVLASIGVLQALFGRVADTATLGARGRLWAAAMDVWTSSPAIGAGPGSFPITLSETAYYQVMGFAPRHADNAPVQLLAESGLLGLAGLAALAAAWLAVALGRRGPEAMAGVAAVAFTLAASMADNPTDSANLVALLVVWASIAAPADRVLLVADEEHGRSGRRRSVAAAAAVMAVAVVAAAVIATTAAAVAFDIARARIGRGGDGAAQALEIATRLDPGMALYVRERGMLMLGDGDLDSARRDFEQALALNPADDTALRGLAIVESLAGAHDRALALGEAAVRLQDSETVNHLLLGWLATRAKEPATARDELSVAIQQAPWITAGPDWTDPLPMGDALADLTAHAVTTSIDAARRTANVDIQPTWLAAMTGRPALRDDARAIAPGLAATTGALLSVFDCDLDEALDELDAAFAAEAHARPYWTVRLLALRAAGEDEDEALRLAAFRASEAVSALAGSTGPQHPLSDGSQDLRFYRREALPAMDTGVTLPSPAQGLNAWLRNPAATAAEVAPQTALASCR